MKKLLLLPLLLPLAPSMRASILQRGKVQLICHRTANRDVPENTLESLALAARMGCDIVEVDVRMTLDGELVLNHDGYLERLTEGMGDVETSSFDELGLYDYGGWMSGRFSPMRIPRFVDALRLAREQGIALHLDIKQKGEGAAIYAALHSEGMTERVLFGGEDGNAEDLRALMPNQHGDRTVWLGPACTRAEVDAAHAQGKFVIANFSDNAHQMDMPAMRAAVAAGVDAINVDYPRLGADAVGRPVETKLAALAAKALAGSVANRLDAIRELSHYSGFPTRALFIRLLGDPDVHVSRAAAVALVLARPVTPTKVFLDALVSNESSARQSAAWALGMTHAPVSNALLPLTMSNIAAERKEALLAISRCPGDVAAEAIMPALEDKTPTVRAAAALALVRHQPEAAAKAVSALLHREEQRSAAEYAAYLQRGKPKLTQAEIDPIIEDYREHMKLVHALELLPDDVALPLLSREAFRSSEDNSHVTSLLAGYGLWDRIAGDPMLAIAALDSSDVEVADRAEWVLVKAGSLVLPQVRTAISTATPAARTRLLHVLAWQGDADALPLLRVLQTSDTQDQALIHWAMQTIQTLQFQP
jgi:glycerophosphoryl diester phosphodiesterase